MDVPLDGRIGPDLDLRPVRSRTGKAQGCRDIDVGRKALGGGARAALEDAGRLADRVEIDALRNHVGCAGKAARGLPVAHRHALDPAECGGGDRVERQQGARGDHETAAGFRCRIDQVGAVEQCCRVDRHERAPVCEGGKGGVAQGGRRAAVDDDVAACREFMQCERGDTQLEIACLSGGLGDVPAGDGEKDKMRPAGRENTRDLAADCTESDDSDFHGRDYGEFSRFSKHLAWRGKGFG